MKAATSSVRSAVGMAVTTGYFATIAQTFSTRGEFTGHVFSLDVPRSQAGRGVRPDDVADFVAGYLNVSRLGQDRLEAALAEAGDDQATHRRWVPNVCDDCDHQDTCHEAFGTSCDRFGMYPFNAAALDRAVDSRLPTNFDPRRLLGTVVRYTLDQHREDIRRGEFPSSAFAQHFAASHLPPLDPELVEDIRALDARDADRRVALLTFWGARPATVVNLLPGIHEAFAVPELPDVDLQRPRRRDTLEPPAVGSRSEQTTDLPVLVERRIASIDQWSDGTAELDQALAGDLRKFLHAAVVARIDWDAAAPARHRRPSRWSSRDILSALVVRHSERTRRRYTDLNSGLDRSAGEPRERGAPEEHRSPSTPRPLGVLPGRRTSATPSQASGRMGAPGRCRRTQGRIVRRELEHRAVGDGTAHPVGSDPRRTWRPCADERRIVERTACRGAANGLTPRVSLGPLGRRLLERQPKESAGRAARSDRRTTRWGSDLACNRDRRPGRSTDRLQADLGAVGASRRRSNGVQEALRRHPRAH